MIRYLKKFKHPYIWKRLFYERLTEPIHLNLISLFIFLFGSHRLKMNFDLVLRQQHAYGLYSAADQAIRLGIKSISIIEFGVAAGAGLLNLQSIAKEITKSTGIKFDIYGFDTGNGMPKPLSFKDHPELYAEGDFPMKISDLQKKLQANTKLIIGRIDNSIQNLINHDFSSSPIGFISIDVDYYSSTVECLRLLKRKAEDYLPRVLIYLDDVENSNHNNFCGELAAINEFTKENPMRPIEKHAFLRSYRIFKNARWIEHIFQAHILDHPHRNLIRNPKKPVVLSNPYL